MSVKFCNISLRERLSYEHIADLPLQTLGFFFIFTLFLLEQLGNYKIITKEKANNLKKK